MEKPTTWYADIVDRVGKFEPVILECVKRELERINTGQTRRARFAGLALNSAESFRTEKCGEADVDAEITSYAKSHKSAVATTDGHMIDSLRKMKVVVLSLRSGRVALL